MFGKDCWCCVLSVDHIHEAHQSIPNITDYLASLKDCLGLGFSFTGPTQPFFKKKKSFIKFPNLSSHCLFVIDAREFEYWTFFFRKRPTRLFLENKLITKKFFYQTTCSRSNHLLFIIHLARLSSIHIMCISCYVLSQIYNILNLQFIW